MTGGIRTTCPYCGVGCGVVARRDGTGAVSISGDPEHPANRGRLCSKGAALGETLSVQGRLFQPMVDGRRAGWPEALDRVASTFSTTIAEHGADAVAFYVSGQLLTEDYYVANKLMKGFIGTANIDTNSRLCMASSVAGHRRAFGTDTVPGTYEDFDLADLVVLVGSNMAWCHPVLYQRLAAAREQRGTKVVVIDPRRTATCEIADLHLPLMPGSDVALFNGLLAHLSQSGALDTDYVARHTEGSDAALAAVQACSLRSVAAATGLRQQDVRAFYDLFTSTPRTVTAYSQGVNQSTSGSDKVNAIINCHLATGRIGRPGMGPFSLTGQPNAMGGREVGGLANMLAAHMEIEVAAHRRIVQDFWSSPRIADKPGLKAVDMFRAVADGRIKALWIMATNPVDSMPDADAVREAIRRCPFVVVSDVARHTDTTALAHILLPSAAWGEKDGTVTNSERRISRQRAFAKAPGTARPDWWQLAEVGKRMGYADAFDYSGPAAIFAEHAALSGRGNSGSRDFDISRFGSITTDDYAALPPVQWPQPSSEAAARERFFGDGGFYTPSRRGRFVATPQQAAALDAEFPLVLNTGRVRDQWHTMTRTGKVPRLLAHTGEPFVAMHPDDAAQRDIGDGELARVASRCGAVVARIAIDANQRRGSVFVPMHWTDQFASHGRIDAVVGADVDPVSGQPGLKFTPVRVERYVAAWYGVVIASRRPVIAGADHWVLAPLTSGWRAEVAGITPLADPMQTALAWLGAGSESDVVSFTDEARGRFRCAVFDGATLAGTVFVSRTPVAVSRTWAGEQVGREADSAPARQSMLAGRAGGPVSDRGPIVCACFDVGESQIAEAITNGGCDSVAAVGDALKAGTNCGSCRPEIAKLVAKRTLATVG